MVSITQRIWVGGWRACDKSGIFNHFMKVWNMMRLILIHVFCLLLIAGCSNRNEKENIPERPNILFIMADDMGSWTLSINDDPNTHTPQLDQLGREGAVLNNCFAPGAVCSPTRASLMTGRYPSETGITDFIAAGDTNGVDLSLPMFPELLQHDGYTTIMVGKWHLGEHNPAFLPTNRGYDRFTGFPHGGMRSMSPNIQVEGEWQMAEGAYTPDLLADYAMAYIREFNPRITGKPFLLSLHFWAPHANTDFPEGMQPAYKGRSWLPMQDIDLARWRNAAIRLPDPDFPNLDTALTNRMAREYYASVHSVDRNVGRVLRLLRELELSDHTVVVFTSDHGYMMGHHGLWHKGNGRWLTRDGLDPAGIYGDSRPNLFDNSMRVPCIFSWPGAISAETQVNESICFTDFFPTILNIANIDQPENITVRGRSFLPLLMGEHMAWNDDHYAEYGHLRTYRSDGWKVVLDFSERQWHELYHLTDDPQEQTNLYNSKDKDVVAVKQALETQLLSQMRRISDPMMAHR
jgi:uncharacterized sulfatase